MNGFLRLILIACLTLSLVRCASAPSEGESPVVDSNFDNLDSADTSADTSSADATGNGSLEDELNQAEGKPSESAAAPAPEDQSVTQDQAATQDQGTDEFSQFENEGQNQQQAEAEQTPPAEEKPAEENPPPPVDVAIEPPPPEVPAQQEAPPPIVEEAPVAEEPAPPAEEQQTVAQIKNIKYKANDNGGTVVIDADSPLTYETRTNADTNQFIIEISNAKLPAKLKRPFNTKDMSGGIGAVDAYQNKGSTTARIVVQLRPGVPEPTVQAEGNSLLVVQSGGGAEPGSQAVAPEAATFEESTPVAENASSAETPAPESGSQSALMSSGSLEDFLSGNTQFYGKKISLEVSQMDVREVFKLISEESGVNLVLSDDVKGTISLKLRQVPWDQALVVIMRAQKLGYTRAGNVLRIAPIADIKAEEEDALKLVNARKAQQPLKVRMLQVSYAKIEDLVNQVKPFLSADRGKVVGDTRSSSIVVTDVDENLDRIAKLVAAIDTPPPQVLIEGKIVEASDQFQRQVGVNWNASGQQGLIAYGSNHRPIRGQTGISVTPSIGASAAQLNFQLGTLDILGDLNATLALYELNNTVKVLSSPRIVTLNNETADITQSTEVPLIKDTVTTAGTVRSVEYKPIKLRLNVTPQITNDASVIMAVEVNRDFLTGSVDQATQATPVASRSAKTKVMVRNAQTAVIGGIYQSDQTNSETKVPWVGDIPILGWLFKSKDQKNLKNELLIFLTPRILGQADSQTIPSQGTGGDIE